MAIEDRGQTLAAFTVNDDKSARRLLESLQKVDEVDGNVEIIDAAVVDRSKRGRIVVHQTHDKGGLKGGAKGAGIGVIVGAIVLGPAGAVVGGAAGGVLNGIRNRIHDSGIDDKFMREVSKEIEKGRSALFVQYLGDWSGSIGMVERAITEEQALLFNSTLPRGEGGRPAGAHRSGHRGARRRGGGGRLRARGRGRRRPPRRRLQVKPRLPRKPKRPPQPLRHRSRPRQPLLRTT